MKKFIIPTAVTALVASLTIIPSVHAASPSSITTTDELEECLESASSDITCTISESFTLENYIEIDAQDKNITIDLGSNTLTKESGSTFSIKNGNVTFMGNGGKIIAKNGLGSGSVYVFGSGDTHLTIEKGVTLSGDNPMVISNNGINTGIVVDIYGDIINDIHPEGSEVDSSAIAIHGSVKVGDPAPTINVYGNVSSKFSAGIYQAGHSTINLEDGSTVTGPSGVVVKSGTLNIGKSTVTATGEPVEEGTSTGDGFTPTGAAIQVDSNSTYAGHIKININDDANLVSEKGDVIQAYGEKEDNLEEINISSNAKMQAAEGKKVLAVSESLNDTFTLTIDDEEVDAETLENISTYGVKEETDTTATGGETKTEDTQNPKTGDDTGLYFILAILGLTGVCVTSKKILSNN